MLILKRPFPGENVAILQESLPPYKKFSASLKQQLHKLIQVFIAEKSFEGCGGLVVTEEMKVIIAAQACMLLLNRANRCYPKLKSILVYPGAFFDNQKRMLDHEKPDTSIKLGESWSSGEVILSWNDVWSGLTNYHDGQNVTFHEFAHQLDQESGVADGSPVLQEPSMYSAWAHIFSREYESLVHKAQRGQKSVLNLYGATNAPEFFAVATEAFFEKPRQLKQKKPELYEELKLFYRVDPLDWL